jgi:hypothetical protein
MFPSSVITDYGAPAAAWLNVTLPVADPSVISIEVTLVNKTATRIPESLVVFFRPQVDNPNQMQLNKLGQLIDPIDIVMNGSHHLHGLSTVGGVQYGDMAFQSLDTSVVSVGGTNLFPVPATKPDLTAGFSFALFNNLWGTNYIMWYPFLPEDATSKYRMIISLPKTR